MVKSKSDYDRRSDDTRFHKWDRLISGHGSNKENKMGIILAIGIIVCSVLFTISYIKNPTILPQAGSNSYEDGLSINYNSDLRSYVVSFSNKYNDTSAMMVQVSIIYDQMIPNQVLVFDRNIKTFPSIVSFRPSVINSKHIVSVTLSKPSGNYTYIYDSIPWQEGTRNNDILSSLI